VEWQYWFTTMQQKRTTGEWWRREYRGLYGPGLELTPDGKANAFEWPAQQ
jgi:hypothetical protein